MLRYVARRFTHQQPKIILSKDEKSFLAYHPEEPHPYEMTRPLPKEEADKETQCLLRINSKHMFTQSPNLEQLQSLTYTHKSYWREFRGKEKREAYKNWFNDNETRKGLTS